MATNKIAGLGTILEYDPADDGTWVSIGCFASLTAPPKRRTSTDAPCLEDTVNAPILGIEESSILAGNLYFLPGTTEHQDLLTMLDTQPEPPVVPWRILWPNADVTIPSNPVHPSWTFSGQLSAFEMQEVNPTDPVVALIEVTRTTAITYETTTTTVTVAAMMDPPLI